MFSDDIARIRLRLEEAGAEEYRLSVRKFAPTATHVYGVKVPILNDMAREFSAAGLGLVDSLWEAGSFEERLLATKILGRLSRKQPEEAWERATRFALDLRDWPTCDTLATEAMRPAIAKFGDEILKGALAFCHEEGEWQRRFGLVLLTNFAKNPDCAEAIKSALNAVSEDKRHYVKKAADWLRRDLRG
ncbi:MAG: DNA alkylation repair protein [Fimbriimonadaceae bacterium]